jgi:predicted SnoaL-like aldol condensation-catalyzing enzyme
MTNSDRFNENKVAMKKIAGMFTTGDLSEVNLVIASDYFDHQGLRGIAIRGQQGFRQVVTAARKGLPNLQVVIQDLIVEDDKVVARLQWHSTDPTGKKIDRETIDILRFINGQAVEHWGAESWTSESSPSDPAQFREGGA